MSEFKQLDNNELLNDVLTILSERDRANVNLVREMEERYFKKKNVFYDEKVHMAEVLEKLYMDGHVEKMEYNDGKDIGYRITHDGRVFLADGGYGRRIGIRQYFSRLSLLERVVGFGALMTGLYYLVRLLLHPTNP